MIRLMPVLKYKKLLSIQCGTYFEKDPSNEVAHLRFTATMFTQNDPSTCSTDGCKKPNRG